MEEDLKSSVKKAKWETSSRSIKQAKRRVTMGVGKFLNTYFKDTLKKDIKSSVLDFEEAFLPITLKKCETLKDWLFMYDSGPSSCMSNEGRAWESANKDKRNKDGFAPVFWYHYNPETSGYFVKRKGKVSARVITHERGKNKKYGRVYSANTSDGNELQSLLEAKGYKKIGDRNWVCSTCT